MAMHFREVASERASVLACVCAYVMVYACASFASVAFIIMIRLAMVILQSVARFILKGNFGWHLTRSIHKVQTKSPAISVTSLLRCCV